MARYTIWDPLRKKDVALTPEERVRQWFIGVLSSEMMVPVHMMMSEASMNLGSKQFRADIIIYGRDASPLAIVECKRPETELDRKVLDQAIRYNMVLNVRYIMVTNGRSTHICRKNAAGDGYDFIDHLPAYSEMTGGEEHTK